MSDEQPTTTEQSVQAQADATQAQVQDIKDAVKDDKAEAKASGLLPAVDSNPVLVGDARHGQPVLHSVPSNRDEPASVSYVDDPTRVLDGQGKEIEKLG